MGQNSSVSGPAGYFLTFTTYGTRLHGDPRGSIHRRQNLLGTPALPINPARQRFEGELLTQEPVLLGEERRRAVATAIAGVCEYRGWRLHALNVRTNHVHVVVTCEAPVIDVLTAFKAYGTRRLRLLGLAGAVEKVWARHGSTKFLRNEQDVIDAVSYVLDYQGEDLGGTIGPARADGDE
jgi:REP element-mobilizing transposase RayT